MNTPLFPPPDTGRRRLPGFDVVRAVALIGVVVMNYHGYLNGGANGFPPSFAERVFDIGQGILTTRFAATFVTIAGVGVVLLTNRSRLSGYAEARREDRWRLIRRGVLLLAVGYTLDWIWNGTILFFYGAFFIVAGLIFTLRIRWLALIGAGSVVVAYAIQAWITHLEWTAGDTTWWYSTSAERSYKGLLLDIFVNGTHPLFPWLAFFCTGLIIGRLVPVLDRYRWHLVGFGVAALAGGYALSSAITALSSEPTGEWADQFQRLAYTDPFSRMPLYVVTTWGSAVAGVLIVAWLGDRYRDTTIVDLLRRAGQMTLSLYILHVLVFNTIVNDFQWVTPTGLDTALVFALCFWIFAIALGAWWNRFVGRGPLETLYRRFGG